MSKGLEALLAAVTSIAAHTYPDRTQQLARRIRRVVDIGSAKELAGWGTAAPSQARLRELLARWKAAGVSAEGLAGMLVGASHAYHTAKAEQSVELVWTGPSTDLVATRKTEQALLEVIDSAREELFVISFVAYGVPSISKALSEATARGVTVSMLLESDRDHGGDITFDAIGHMRASVPEARMYCWEEKGADFIGGKVHGKAAVADGRVCFITSANLTGHAMEKNMELGILIRGGDVPGQLIRHLRAMVATRVIKRI